MNQTQIEPKKKRLQIPHSAALELVCFNLNTPRLQHMPPCKYLFFSKRKGKRNHAYGLLVATEFHTTSPTPWPRLTSPRSQKLSETTPELRQADLQRSPLPTPAATEPHRRRLQTHIPWGRSTSPTLVTLLFSSLVGLSYQPTCTSEPPAWLLLRAHSVKWQPPPRCRPLYSAGPHAKS